MLLNKEAWLQGWQGARQLPCGERGVPCDPTEIWAVAQGQLKCWRVCTWKMLTRTGEWQVRKCGFPCVFGASREAIMCTNPLCFSYQLLVWSLEFGEHLQANILKVGSVGMDVFKLTVGVGIPGSKVIGHLGCATLFLWVNALETPKTVRILLAMQWGKLYCMPCGRSNAEQHWMIGNKVC